jgi:hypothetical protein
MGFTASIFRLAASCPDRRGVRCQRPSAPSGPSVRRARRRDLEPGSWRVRSADRRRSSLIGVLGAAFRDRGRAAALRVSFDPALNRHGAADGGWWPHSRNALTELPGLIAALDSQPGVRVQQVSIHRDDWDEIPHRLTTDAGQVLRVDWFTTIPRHTVSVTTADRDPIALLVVPPGASDGAAQAADILTASEAQSRPSA